MATETTTVEQLIDPLGACLSPDVARRIVDLRADAKLQARVDELADKANVGTITDEERCEYEKYVSYASFVTMLQIKAKNLLEQSTGAA